MGGACRMAGWGDELAAPKDRATAVSLTDPDWRVGEVGMGNEHSQLSPSAHIDLARTGKGWMRLAGTVERRVL